MGGSRSSSRESSIGHNGRYTTQSFIHYWGTIMDFALKFMSFLSQIMDFAIKMVYFSFKMLTFGSRSVSLGRSESTNGNLSFKFEVRLANLIVIIFLFIFD